MAEVAPAGAAVISSHISLVLGGYLFPQCNRFPSIFCPAWRLTYRSPRVLQRLRASRRTQTSGNLPKTPLDGFLKKMRKIVMMLGAAGSNWQRKWTGTAGQKNREQHMKFKALSGVIRADSFCLEIYLQRRGLALISCFCCLIAGAIDLDIYAGIGSIMTCRRCYLVHSLSQVVADELGK